ncbi:UDP-N-acetylglucosamine:LPS N-acetylglucosamine transferase [Nonlabens sp. Hel1_33_55]|uniref:UDP-glycosyltransferase n=1 Tax=Nonlabens sp. Hel1_33_55 TaxID=1336802 RepID=UPI000875AB78|nr:UDP-glycosyltransferase [Nonlabens sp. Hel1_33_55]SCX92580.1 UDP-N-acetylglucosamine:LPS N-acetylglucosamine transferase [Nonlabens sp. Hel1_33_55]
MHSKKVFILFPDGVGLRNFAFTGFKEIGEQLDFDITYWNNTIFPIQSELGYKELHIGSTKIHPKTPVLSHARKRVELALSRKRANDHVYNTYRFPLKWNGPKHFLKSAFVKFHERFNATPHGWQRLMDQMYAAERSTDRYQKAKTQLQEHQPDLVFCTTQRATQAIAPMLAAKDLGIKTACWIYSWDNLPKGMSTIETDYYFVWSDLMKQQMLEYYPKTVPEQIFVTGTPQFEPHYDNSILLSRKQFCEEHHLDEDTQYICFSGDDQTTSPLDQYYLEDTAIAVRKLRDEGYNLAIIYRQVPIDFTGRYDKVLEKYADVITTIAPLWKPMGEHWNQVMPTKADFARLVNTCYHSEMVVNICSSMVFDFVIHGKPTIFPNYEQPQLKKGIRDIGQNYEYIHFRSMPDREKSVVWAYNKSEIYEGIKGLLDGALNPVSITKQWYEVVNRSDSPNKASERIWKGIAEILPR